MSKANGRATRVIARLQERGARLEQRGGGSWALCRLWPIDCGRGTLASLPH